MGAWVMRTGIAAAALAILLVACGRPAAVGAPVVQQDVAPAPPASLAKTAGAAEPKLEKPAAPAVPVGVSVPQLAYSYEAQVEAPAAAVPGLLARHEAVCRQAGPALCQVIASERSSSGGDDVHAALTVRAEPAWLQRFRDGLPGEAQAAGGKVTGGATKTEDLTRSIVDTDASLRAKTLLATRLERLLGEHNGKLSDLLEVEQALAQTQGEIDAAKSELAVMRTRVATSELKVGYDSRPALASSGAWRPLTEAMRQATGVFAFSLGLMVTLFAGVLPFALAAGAAVAGPLAWRRRRARRRLAPPTA